VELVGRGANEEYNEVAVDVGGHPAACLFAIAFCFPGAYA